MYKVILTVIHNVRRFVGDRLLPKAYTVISLGVFFYVAATLIKGGQPPHLVKKMKFGIFQLFSFGGC